jgi:hypothetical protein
MAFICTNTDHILSLCSHPQSQQRHPEARTKQDACVFYFQLLGPEIYLLSVNLLPKDPGNTPGYHLAPSMFLEQHEIFHKSVLGIEDQHQWPAPYDKHMSCHLCLLPVGPCSYKEWTL